MNFRLCRESDFGPLKKLWVQCFGDEEPWTSWFFSEHYQANRTWVGEMDGVVAAQAHLLPHRLRLRGRWHDAAFFVGVCVDERLRGQGFGRELMSTAQEELRRNGFSINILQPRWPDFYRRLGWDFCYDRQVYRVPLSVASLLLAEPPPGTVCMEGEYAALASVYETFTKPRHGYAGRSKADWEALLKDHRGEGGGVAIVSKNGTPCGYALYNTTRGMLYIRELVWTEAHATDALLKHLTERGLAAGAENLEWLDPAGDPVSVLSSVSEPEPFLMGRIHDLQGWAANVEYPRNLSADLKIRVSDPIAAWNNGLFRWRIHGGKGCMLPIEAMDEPDLDMDIGRLSQLFFGYAGLNRPSPSTDFATSEVAAELLAELFPSCRNFISEYF